MQLAKNADRQLRAAVNFQLLIQAVEVFVSRMTRNPKVRGNCRLLIVHKDRLRDLEFALR